jgi:hypothetical protein
VVDLTYDFSSGGISRAGFRVRTDVGTLLAKTSFRKLVPGRWPCGFPPARRPHDNGTRAPGTAP